MVKGLGWRLENLRDKSEYSQKEISAKLGFSNNTYGQYEREERNPSIGTLIKLADFYNVSLDYLLRGEEYEGNASNLTKDAALKDTLDIFKRHEINDPYILRTEQWKTLSRDDLISLTKHFEWTVSQVNEDK